MNNFKAGFSLIELMVVIAIVAILAAVAVPAYKNYLITTRGQLAGQAILNLQEKTLMYYNKHGVFPTQQQLAVAFFNGDLDTEHTLSPYINGILTWSTVGTNGQCLFRVYSLDTNSLKIGSYSNTDTSGTHVFNAMEIIADVNGAIIRGCSLSLANNNTGSYEVPPVVGDCKDTFSPTYYDHYFYPDLDRIYADYCQ